jgi:hypothetical protein
VDQGAGAGFLDFKARFLGSTISAWRFEVEKIDQR